MDGIQGKIKNIRVNNNRAKLKGQKQTQRHLNLKVACENTEERII